MVKIKVLYILFMFCIFCFTSSVKAESGLVGWWKFDEGDGDILHDSSGNNNHGKISERSALLFGSKDDYVDCGNDVSLQIDGPLTISMWVNVSTKLQGHNYIGSFDGLLSEIKIYNKDLTAEEIKENYQQEKKD